MFGYVPSENKGEVTPCSVEQIKGGFLAERVWVNCQRIAEAATRVNKGGMTQEKFEDLKSREKKKLPGWTPMAAWTGNRRKKEDAVANGLVMADLDHLAAPIRVYERSIRPLAEEGIVRLCHLTPSTASDRSTGGLRIIFRCPERMDVVQAQAWLYDRLTDVPEECKDRCVKDLSRISYFVPASYILHPLNGVDGLDEAFEDITPLAVAPTPVSSSTPAPMPAPEPTAEDLPTEYLGIPYERIVDALLQELGGTPSVGQRNNRVQRMGVHLRGITDNDEALLRSIIPTFGLPEAEWRRTIHGVCQSEGAPFVTHLMRQVLQRLDPNGGSPALLEPPMPEKLPRLIKLVLEPIPELYHPVVANAACAAFATYLHNVTFDYIDGRTMEAALMHVTIAPTSTGKGCINEAIRHIMAPILARSTANRERDQQWKNLSASRSANERGPQRPSGLVVQFVRPDMTSAALIQRLHDAEGHFLFTQMDELECLDKLKDQKFTVIKCAFDCADWGAERVGKESVSLTAPLKFNWCASTTPGVARKFFARSLTDGTLNRLNISSIPPQEIGAPMPVYGRYTEKWDARLAPYIANLEQATGHVHCPQALKLARAIAEELRDIAIATDDRTFETLSFRANVIGYRKAMVLWLANGCKWEKAFEDFIRWSVQYDLYCKYYYFGAAISQAEASDNACIGRRGPVDWLLGLPHEFTVADLLNLRARHDDPTDEKRAKRQIQKWIERKKVARADEQGRFVKL